jgi:hypothetical protein
MIYKQVLIKHVLVDSILRTNYVQANKDVVQKKLQSALTYIYLSMDIWTSPNNLLMLGITADFVDCEDGKHTKVSMGAMALWRKRLMIIVLARDWRKSKKQLCALTLGLQARGPTL